MQSKEPRIMARKWNAAASIIKIKKPPLNQELLKSSVAACNILLGGLTRTPRDMVMQSPQIILIVFKEV